MRSLTLAGLVVGSTLAAFGQNPFPNPVRPMPVPPNASPYGNILFPGGIPNSFPTQLGATVSGRPPYTGVQPGRGPVGHPGGRPRTVVVPYAVPMYYGGYGYDPYYGQQAPVSPNVTVVVPQQPAPTVIINQTFGGGELAKQELAATDGERGGLKVYEAPKAQPAPEPAAKRSYVRDDKPNIYLIALKDAGKVKEAIGYWVEGGTTLAYVTPDASIERVALDLVDREGSKQLNAQRNLDFDLRSR